MKWYKFVQKVHIQFAIQNREVQHQKSKMLHSNENDPSKEAQEAAQAGWEQSAGSCPRISGCDLVPLHILGPDHEGLQKI